MTYAIKLNPTTAAILDGYCRAAGHTLRTVLGDHLTRRASAATLPPAPAPAPEPQPVLPTPASLIAEPEPVETRPMDPAAEDAILAQLGA